MNIGNYRAPFINYRNPGIFLITMVKNDYIPVFSTLHRTGLNDKYKGTNVIFSPLGKFIFNILSNFSTHFPGLNVHQYVIMPDHIHFILEITKKLDAHLDEYMDGFKNKIFREAYINEVVGFNDFIFRAGYNDQFLSHSRSLNIMYTYIRENPYRLWIRKEHPEFFSKMNNGNIFGFHCQFYGNLELLKNPFIYSVIRHSKYTETEISKRENLWLYGLKNGGVLAGAFIHKEERKFLLQAIEMGSKVIKFNNYKFDEKEKPSGYYFKMCEKGNLLIISPTFPADFVITHDKHGKPKVTKQQSRFMNSIIEKFENH